jgi:transcriptional regulator with XRE-family HTH domain
MKAKKVQDVPPAAPRIGPIIQRERKSRKLTLEQLAALSGVSKSMLSQIERGQANPTFAVLWGLTQALGIDFPDLLGGGAVTSGRGQIELVTAAHTPQIRSADGRCRLRILSSPRLAGITEWYDIEMDAGAKLDSAPHAHGSIEHFTALSDGFQVVSGDSVVSLNKDETARYAVDVPHSIANLSGRTVRGFLVVLYR